MMNLPEDFIRETRLMMGEKRFNRFMEALQEEPPVSIRLNPRKVSQKSRPHAAFVPWCPEGIYLEGRPQFTFDPLFHAGCYYVQEASSMFITHVLRTLIAQHFPPAAPLRMLDLCAAPGGKSTAAVSVLPEGSWLTSNEPIRSRYMILEENMTKWGYDNCTVTNLYPRDIRKRKETFDVILCDVPCSGEGMFRKDPATTNEWSLKNVERCWRLQREIVAEAWKCLNPGGVLIYSTCTYNIKENEENVRYFMEEYGAELLSIPTDPEWGISGSLLEGFDAPVYRFIPGFTQGEGLFMAVLQHRGTVPCVSKEHQRLNYTGTVPSVLRRLTPDLPQGDFPRIDLSYADALKYLRGEALVLPEDTPRGMVTVTYKGFSLGPAKNLGTRANNLYPKAWRIKTTHLPTVPPQILELPHP